MPSVILSAIFSSFLFVRLIKGPWLRNPQYLAAAMIGSAILSLVGNSLFPGSADDMLMSNIWAFGGSLAGIFLFDFVT